MAGKKVNRFPFSTVKNREYWPKIELNTSQLGCLNSYNVATPLLNYSKIRKKHKIRWSVATCYNIVHSRAPSGRCINTIYLRLNEIYIYIYIFDRYSHTHRSWVVHSFIHIRRQRNGKNIRIYFLVCFSFSSVHTYRNDYDIIPNGITFNKLGFRRHS